MARIQIAKGLMNTLCAKAGVRYFRYHALRHAGASLLDSHSVPLGFIQRLLGHENRETTEIYLHSLGSAEREAIKHLDQSNDKPQDEKSHTESHTGQNRRLRLVT